MKFYDLGSLQDSLLNRVVIICKYENKWVLCKQKTKDTWEIPGGHIEEGETWLEAAKRELYEETGTLEADIKPICLYAISKYGLLCYANIEKITDLPDSEIEKIEFFDEIPNNLTYPWHLYFFNKVEEKDINNNYKVL